MVEVMIGILAVIGFLSVPNSWYERGRKRSQ
jgi:hypothetical protein